MPFGRSLGAKTACVLLCEWRGVLLSPAPPSPQPSLGPCPAALNQKSGVSLPDQCAKERGGAQACRLHAAFLLLGDRWVPA